MKSSARRVKKGRASAVDASVHAHRDHAAAASASAAAALRLVVSRCLVGGLELYGVYGASLAARDLASLARSCRAFVPIAREGFQKLSREVARQEDAKTAPPPPPFEPEALARLPAGLGWPFWEALLGADTAAVKEADVNAAAAALGLNLWVCFGLCAVARLL